MRNVKKIGLILSFILILTNAGYAQSEWSFEVHVGEVFNVPLPLSIVQNGYPKINMTARFRTEAFTPPIYWDWRISHWKGQRSWELEVIHQKLYLKNTTSEVQKFNISHGFNLLMINRGFDKGKFRLRTGAGIVLAHPESKIRGMEFGNTSDDFDMGYFISGPAANFALSKPIRINNRFFVNTEAKTTLAWSRVKIAGGHAEVFNLAFHLILGLGIKLPGR